MSRRLALVSSVVFVMGASGAMADEPVPRPHHAILVDPIAPLLGAVFGAVALELEYQWAPHDYVGLSVIPSFAYVKLTVSGSTATGIGGGARVGPRILPQGRRLGGAYVLPFAGYFQSAASSGSTSYTFRTIPVGIEAGYSWVWDNGFVINLGGGLSYDIQLADDPETYLPITPILNFTLGYAW